MKRKKVLLCGLAIIVYGILVCGCESTVSTESATQTEEVAQQMRRDNRDCCLKNGKAFIWESYLLNIFIMRKWFI